MMGRVVAVLSEAAPRVVFYRLRWLWDLGFWAFTGPAPARAVSQRLLARLGAPGLLRLVERVAARRRRLRVPADDRGARAPSALAPARRCRCSPGSPTSPRSTTGRARAPTRTSSRNRRRSRRCAGSRAPEPLSRRVPGSPTRRSTRRGRGATRAARSSCRRTARSCSSRAAAGASATSRARSTEALGIAGASIVCLTGRNEELRAALAHRFAGEPRVRVEGFTERDGGLARRRRRARPLDRRADRARGACSAAARSSPTAGGGATSASTTTRSGASGSPTSSSRGASSAPRSSARSPRGRDRDLGLQRPAVGRVARARRRRCALSVPRSPRSPPGARRPPRPSCRRSRT